MTNQTNNKTRENEVKQLIERLLDVYDQEIKSELKKKYNNQKNLTDCDNVIFSLTTKSTKTTRAILHLSDQGYIEDGFILVRSLLENVINLKFILRNQQIYCKMFLNYGYYDWFRKIKALSENTTQPDFARQCKNLLRNANHSKYKQIEQFRKCIEGTDYSWSKKSIREMSELVDLENPYYNKVYFYLSQYTHPHISGLKGYSSKSNGITIFDDSPSLKGVEELLITTLDLYFRQITLLANYARIKNTSINEIKNDLEKLVREINKNDETNQ